MTEALINTTDYSTLELVFFALGGIGWVVAYALVLRGIAKHKFVEVPAAAVVANMAWETTWGILNRTDLGVLFMWGYRLWFVLDLFIFWQLFRYGTKQVSSDAIKRWFRPAAVFGVACWLVTLVFFVREGYDTPNGLTTGFAVTLMMSALYLVVYVQHPNPEWFSYVVGWAKLFGNGFAAVFCFMAFPDMRLLLTMCVVTFVLDVAYVAVFRSRQPSAAAAVA